MNAKQEILNRELPPLLAPNQVTLTNDEFQILRKRFIHDLSEHMYGFTPPAPKSVWVEKREFPIKDRHLLCGGKVTTEYYNLFFDTPKGEFSFPFVLALPNGIEKPPVVLHMAFRPLPDSYIPLEEITDQGFGVAVVVYNDISFDGVNSDFTLGLADHFIGARPRKKNEIGRVGLWAYGAMRLMDYLMTRDDIDTAHIAVNGHSRLGKTALWVGAQDERFFAVHCNEGGYGGSGLHRGHIGEIVSAFVKVGSKDFFCENFLNTLDMPESARPTDQHMLLACIAPRYLYVSSAEFDHCMDWRSDFLSCYAASEVYKAMGKDGFIAPEEIPDEVPFHCHEGTIGYHVRKNHHYLSREDWNLFLSFLKKKLS